MKLLKISVKKFYRTNRILCKFINIGKINPTYSIYLGNFIRKSLLETQK